MKEKELFLVVIASLLICAVAVYVSGPAEEPYTKECLVVSIENVTITEYDPEWVGGTWFYLEPIHTYDQWIIAEPR